MKLLLDTHIVLWFFNDDNKLSKEAFDAILASKNEKYVSIVSAWELAIKLKLNKLSFDGGVSNFFTMLEENGFELLPVKKDYIKNLEILPLFHRDPFDRMLIASAVTEGMRLISTDVDIQQYISEKGISDNGNE